MVYRITQQGTLGTATITDETTGAFQYVAGATTGQDTFKFKVNDGFADSNEATVSVTVN